MEAFSDGVFAIVITLLILEIHIPSGLSPEELGPALLHLLPELATYVLSFLLVGLYWMVHHRYVHRLAQVTGPLLWINLLWLMCISFLPFPTSLLGNYPLQVVPIVVYGANLILANVSGLLATLYAYRHPETIAEPFTAQQMRRLIPRYVGVNALYLVASAISPWVPLASYVLFGVVLAWLIYHYASDH